MKIQSKTETAHLLCVTTSAGRTYRKNAKGYWCYGILNIPVTDMNQRKLDIAFHNFQNSLKANKA